MKPLHVASVARALTFAIASLAVSSMASAQITVSPRPIDTTTRGDWRGVYGECFNAVPSCDPLLFECPTGPDFFGTAPGQYDVCITGAGAPPVDPTQNFDFRLFQRGGDATFTWSYCEPGDPSCPVPTPENFVRPGTSQFNACLGTFRNGTWDNDRFVHDPMSAEVDLKVGGDATLAFYFLNGAVECRDLDYALFVDDVLQLNGRISDIANGKYVVFDLFDIPPSGALVRLDVLDNAGTASCGIAGEVTGLNSVISGIFIDGTTACAPSCGNGVVEPELGETCDPPGSVPDVPPGNQNVCRDNCTYCGDGIVNNGEECDDPNDPRCTDTCELAPCELDVEKFCTVPEPDVRLDECDSDNGDLLEIELEYLGGDCSATTNTQEGKVKCSGSTQASQPVNVAVTKDADKVAVNGVIGGTGGFALGDSFTITNLEDAPKLKKLKGSTKLRLTGPAGSQDLTIHTSCSKPLVLGDVFGALRLVSVTTAKGGKSTLPDPGPPVLSQVCELVGGKLGSCADGKPRALVFRYTGAACQSPLANPQGGKASCSGSAGGDGAAVTITKDADKVSATPTTLNVGDRVTIAASGNRLESQTELRVGGQSLSFHTSCSQVLRVGDVFGSLTLERFIPEGASIQQDGNVVYTYRVRHNDVQPVSVNLFDDQDVLGPAGTDVLVPPGETVTLTEEAFITQTTVNTVTATDNGQICGQDRATVIVEVVEPPGSCADGKPKTLAFEYTGQGCGASNNTQTKDSCAGDPGGALATVVVTKDASKISASPSSGIAIGNLITVTTTESKLPSEIKLAVTGPGGTQSLTIHTSCSDNLIVGEQFGSLILRKFVPEQ